MAFAEGASDERLLVRLGVLPETHPSYSRTEIGARKRKGKLLAKQPIRGNGARRGKNPRTVKRGGIPM